MNDKKKPELRFPEFTDDWEPRKLGEIYTERNEKGDESLQILSVSIHSGVSDGELDEEKLGKTVRRSADKTTYKHVYYGDLIFNMMRAWQGAIGVAKSEGMISPAYISAIPNDELFPLFMDYALRRKEAIEQIDSLSYGVTDFRKRLYWKAFVNVKCFLPHKTEQQKIWSFFNSLDKLIALHQSKCDKLKEYKRGCLQKMFPRDGAKAPEVRFPGFTDAWEQRKFGDVGSVAMCKRIFKEQTSEEGDVPFYKIGTFGGTPDAYISRELFEEYKKAYQYPSKGDILISASGSIGRTVEYTGEDEYFQDSNIVWLKHGDNIDNAFLKVLYSVVEWSCEGSTIKRLYNDNFLKTEFMLPYIDEQTKIGEFFSKIDNLITLHQRKCEKYKEIEKGLLQKLFI